MNNLNGGTIMQPIFKKVQSFEVVGLSGRFNVKNKHEIPALWDKFIPMMNSLPYCSPCPAFGICECIQDSCCTQAQSCEEMDFNYTAGVEKSAFLEEIPEGLSVVKVPAKSYAVFQTSLTKIADTYSYIYGTWVQNSGYELDGHADFEFYGRDFDHTNPESPLYIYIPIKEK
jgi:predicted transcriptional regulator YdeE